MVSFMLLCTFYIHANQNTNVDNDLSESFFMIPSAKETMALKRENVALKSEADALRKRLEATEKVLQLRKEQDLHLRDSIYMATKEVAIFRFLLSIYNISFCNRHSEQLGPLQCLQGRW